MTISVPLCIYKVWFTQDWATYPSIGCLVVQLHLASLRTTTCGHNFNYHIFLCTCRKGITIWDSVLSNFTDQLLILHFYMRKCKPNSCYCVDYNLMLFAHRIYKIHIKAECNLVKCQLYVSSLLEECGQRNKLLWKKK